MMSRTRKAGLDSRQEAIIDKNLIEANISLMDKNKLLEADNIILQRRHNKAIKDIKNYIKTEKENYIKAKLEEIMGILEGNNDEINKT